MSPQSWLSVGTVVATMSDSKLKPITRAGSEVSNAGIIISLSFKIVPKYSQLSW